MKQEDKKTAERLKNIVTSATPIVKKYFNIMPDKENEEGTIQSISAGVSFHGATLWVLVFAIFIASLGLNVNSTAVIIGAMLISPLMGPIIGMGLAVGINDFDLLKRSAKNYIVATVISVATATIYFLLTPLDEAQSELLARTSPTLYDVLIALFGGAAGIVALATKGKGNVLPGVAIATALMPPLCTAGFGIATGNIYYFLGAFYLFFINTVFISLATYLGVRMMKFRQKQFINKERYLKVKRYIVIVVVATMVPSFFMTYSIVKNSIFETNVRKFINERLETPGTQVITYNVNKDSLYLRVVAVGRELSDSSINNAEKAMAELNRGLSFNEVASRYSEGPEKEDGGDLGMVEDTVYPEIFSEAFKLRVGEYSDIIKSEYGYHIFLVKEYGQAKQASYDALKTDIHFSLYNKEQNKKIEELIDELYKNALIEYLTDIKLSDYTIKSRSDR